jgi:F-type H+-transporting ATPase subunit b
MLTIDFSVIIQVVNFLVLLFLLNAVLYRPIRRILKRRNDEIEGLTHSAAELEEKSLVRSRGLEESNASARREGFREKESLRSEAMEAEKKMYHEATTVAGGKMEEARKRMVARVQEIRKELEKEMGTFSSELAEKILGRRLS